MAPFVVALATTTAGADADAGWIASALDRPRDGRGRINLLSDARGQTFEAELQAQRGNRALAFAHTEEKLRDVARTERSKRQFTFWMLQTMALGGATATSVALARDERRQPGSYALLYGMAALTSGLGFLVLSIETPSERLLRLYRDDPGIKLRAGVSALPSGGMGLGISGTF